MSWLREVADSLYRSTRYIQGRLWGWTIGEVVDVEDPWGWGRVRIRLPWHREGEASDWAWPIGARMWDEGGSTFPIPQPGEVVVVVFLEGDITKPGYLGTVWTPGGTGPLGKIPSHKPLIRGKASKTPEDYDPSLAPDTSPKPYSEPPDGAWVTNHPKDRVDEWRWYGGIRFLWEAFKRRLRFWTHPQTPFKVQVEHYDGDSVSPPRGTPYHALTVESPDGTRVLIEDDGSSGKWTVRLLHKAGHFLEMVDGGGNSKITVSDKSGNKVVLDAIANQIIIQANSKVLVKAPTVTVDSPDVNLGGEGGPVVARVGDMVRVVGVQPGPATVMGEIISGASTTKAV